MERCNAEDSRFKREVMIVVIVILLIAITVITVGAGVNQQAVRK